MAKKYHTHELPSGKKYSHPIKRKHISIRARVRRIKERIVPAKLKAPIYRITHGRSYYAVEETKGTPAPFLTIYVWVFTRHPEEYSEVGFRNEVETVKHNLFIDQGVRAKEHWEDSVEEQDDYNLRDAGLDEIGELKGFEVQRVDKDEVVNEIDVVHKSAVFYGRGGSLKEEYKF